MLLIMMIIESFVLDVWNMIVYEYSILMLVDESFHSLSSHNSDY